MIITAILNKIKKIYPWVLPYTCLLCKHPSTLSIDLCHDCLHSLPSLTQSCMRCANAFTLENTNLNLCCGECLKKPPAFDKTFALFSYDFPIPQLIMQLKFQGNLMNAKLLGTLLSNALTTGWYAQQPLPEVIIPMPLHPQRLRERGFNQTIEIARPIAKALKIPLNLHDCHRIKATLAQAQLSLTDRQKNLEQAFVVAKHFNYHHVAVIDDVITTGQTMTTFCKALKKSGVAQIDVWCCAKTQWKGYR
jgi:ComF family protein